MHQISQTSLRLNKLQCNLWLLKPCFIVFMLILFSMWYCQFPYENDELEAGKIIPVVIGYMDNTDGPHEVSIHYARPYNGAIIEPVAGANVYITDGMGNIYQLYEENEGEGNYITLKGELKGTIGQTYQLNVIMPDGRRILSEPSIIPPTIEVDTGFYQGNYKWTEMDNDVDGTPLVKTRSGWGAFAVIKNLPQGVAYYRVSCNPIGESVYATIDTFFTFYTHHGLRYGFEMLDIHHYYGVFKSLEPLRIGKLFANNNYTREELTINAFRSQQRSPSGLPLGKGDLYMVAWILPFRIHSISPEIYQFYENQIAQLEAPDRIYDPIPTQLTGNLFMEGDKHLPVLGMFETSSVGRMNMSVETIVYKEMAIPNVRILPDTITLPRDRSNRKGNRIQYIFLNYN